MVIVFGLIVVLGALGWGLYRSLSYGRLGLLAWLQSLVLAFPLLVWLAALSFGIGISIVVVLGLLLVAIGAYSWLGHKIRIAAKSASQSDVVDVAMDADADADRTSESLPNWSSTQSDLGTKRSNNEPAVKNHSGLSAHQQSFTKFSSVSSEDGSGGSKTLNRRIPDSDLQQIQNIFSIDTFFSTEQSLYYNGALFKGNLRGEPETVHHTLSQRLAAMVGEQYRLFLMVDPQSKPIVLVFPKANDPVPSTRLQWLLSLVLFGVTMLTCMVAAAIFQGFDLLQSWERWPETLFLVLGLAIILGGHEVGHWVVAHRYRLRLSPPFFLPALQIGSFGALTRFESVIPHRTALFDVAFAGPAIGGVISLFLFVLGLFISHQGSVFQLSSSFFQSSILVGVLARTILGDSLLQDIVDIDPLVVVGWLGLLITAINLMPIGQLDGGRIVQAIYGRKVIRLTSVVTLIVLTIATLASPLALYWMVVILFLQRQLEQPQQNELTEPNDTRAALGLLALFVMAAMLLPLSPGLASRIGIGG